MTFYRTLLTAVLGLFLTFKVAAQSKIIVMPPSQPQEKYYPNPVRLEAGVHISPMINLANDGFADDPVRFMALDFGLTLDWLKEESIFKFGTGITYLSRSIESEYRQVFLPADLKSYSGRFRVAEIPLFISVRLGELDYLKSYLKVGLLCDFIMRYSTHQVSRYYFNGAEYVYDKSYGPGSLSESGYRFFNTGLYLGACQDYELSDNLVLRWDWSMNLHRFKNDLAPDKITAWFLSPGIRIGLAYNIHGLKEDK